MYPSECKDITNTKSVKSLGTRNNAILDDVPNIRMPVRDCANERR